MLSSPPLRGSPDSRCAFIGELLTAARLQGALDDALRVIELMRIDASAPGLHGKPLAPGVIGFEY